MRINNFAKAVFVFLLKDIMVRRVLSVKSDTLIYNAIKKLADNGISGLPVVDDDKKLVGMLSEYDVLQVLTDYGVENRHTVEQYMTKHVISFQEDDSAIDVCEFFKSNNKRRVPVTKAGKLVGIVSRHDIIKLILSTRKKVDYGTKKRYSIPNIINPSLK